MKNRIIPIKKTKTPVPKTGIIPKVTLLFDHILTTTNKNIVRESDIIVVGKDRTPQILTDQYVVACGSNSSVKVGDRVEIAVERFDVKYKKPAHDVGPNIAEIQVPVVVIDGNPYLYLSTREIKWIYDKEEK